MIAAGQGFEVGVAAGELAEDGVDLGLVWLARGNPPHVAAPTANPVPTIAPVDQVVPQDAKP